MFSEDLPKKQLKHLSSLLLELGIDPQYPIKRGLPFCAEPNLKTLVVAEIDYEGKPLVLTKEAAKDWKNLVKAAQKAKLEILPFSGFRSYRYQANLIKRKLEAGRSLDEILAVLAVPGYSEHHTGCAVDLTTTGCPPLTEELENTKAFHWLKENASDFGFYLSFPRDNSLGFIYEPWHWCWKYTQRSSSCHKESRFVVCTG